MQIIERKHTNQRMSQIVIHGKTVYLAGQVGEPHHDVADQTRDALAPVVRRNWPIHGYWWKSSFAQREAEFSGRRLLNG
jgi:alkyl sulfatase BDS1-like metallo-beta-lactamase superfamily hydrolase